VSKRWKLPNIKWTLVRDSDFINFFGSPKLTMLMCQVLNAEI